MDWLSPLHLLVVLAVVAILLGPERAGRATARVVSWLRAFRQAQASLTPTGMAQRLFDAALAPPAQTPPPPGGERRP
ncbi:MAG: hypothetical protein K6T92_01855 [Candidatus Rokubacteria bacterium]|nr:hypothetical protein [Candidatus Rokubacteria bacterium]